MASNQNDARPEQKTLPSREHPEAAYWQRAKKGLSEYLSTNAGLKTVDNLKAEV